MLADFCRLLLVLGLTKVTTNYRRIRCDVNEVEVALNIGDTSAQMTRILIRELTESRVESIIRSQLRFCFSNSTLMKRSFKVKRSHQITEHSTESLFDYHWMWFMPIEAQSRHLSIRTSLKWKDNCLNRLNGYCLSMSANWFTSLLDKTRHDSCDPIPLIIRYLTLWVFMRVWD